MVPSLAAAAGEPVPSGPVGPGRSEHLERAAATVGSRREARWIVDHALAFAPADVGTVVDRLAARRAAGEPLQYVLGRWPFRTLDLVVDRRALIPRPETEDVAGLAIDAAIDAAIAAAATTARSAPGAVRVADLGTGTGAIALSVAAEATAAVTSAGGRLEVCATDTSDAALSLAAVNLAGAEETAAVEPGTVHLARGSWWEALDAGLRGTLDVVVANPPYVGEGELAGLDPVVRDWEPVSALVAPAGPSGVEGTAGLEAILGGAVDWLRPGGTVVLELAPPQAAAMAEAGKTAGLVDVRVADDLAGRPRALVARRP